MNSVKEVFGDKLRIRACGLCFQGDAILLVKHNIDGQFLWSPPGGGVEFGESIEDTLIREFREETCLDVEPGNFLFLHEFIESRSSNKCGLISSAVLQVYVYLPGNNMSVLILSPYFQTFIFSSPSVDQ